MILGGGSERYTRCTRAAYLVPAERRLEALPVGGIGGAVLRVLDRVDRVGRVALYQAERRNGRLGGIGELFLQVKAYLRLWFWCFLLVDREVCLKRKF